MKSNLTNQCLWTVFRRWKGFLIKLIFLIIFTTIAHAEKYYVNNTSGNDTNSGSFEAPWKTISKVNTADLQPGDSVFFARNQSYRGNLIVKSGSSSKAITYSAYGCGGKPVFLGSINRSVAENWTSAGGNLWITSDVETIDGSVKDAGNLIFNNEASIGWKVSDIDLVNGQGKFWSNPEDKTLTLYSDGNPASYYSNIEIALNKGIISIADRQYVNIENLELRYGSGHGISGGSSHNIRISKVDMFYIGGSYLSGTSRYGNGVEFWNDAHDNRVEGCRFSQIYDAALTNQGILDGCKQYNLYYINNVIDSSEYSFEIWLRGEGSEMQHVYFENNTCLDAGKGWGNIQRVDPNGSHLCLWGFDCSLEDIYMRNNIFSGVNGGGIFTMNLAILNDPGICIDHNDWHLSDQLALNSGWDSERPGPINTIYDWNYYRTHVAQDANSITDDPLLEGFGITAVSPCVNRGFPSTIVNYDFKGLARPQGSAYDIGACEVDASEISIKIMPLGDSKTEGGDAGTWKSWRGYLRAELMGAGYKIDYVGPRAKLAEGDAEPYDRDHAGFGGYSIGPDSARWRPDSETSGVFEHIQDYFFQENPDIVLVALGVNDMFNPETHVRDYSKTAPQRYKALLNKIISLKPSVKIICGTVEPVGWGLDFSAAGSDLGILNDTIRALANADTTDNIFLAEIHDHLLETWITDSPDFYDGVHLSSSGAIKVAAAWFEIVPKVINAPVIFSRIAVSGVELLPSASIYVNSTKQLSANVLPVNATNKNVSWVSSDTTILIVDDFGLVKAIAEGSARISVYTQEGAKTASCIITTQNKSVSSLSINNERVSLYVGDTFHLKATIWPLDATNQALTWTSSDSLIASVRDGIILGRRAGTAGIKASSVDGNKSASCIATINAINAISILSAPTSISPTGTSSLMLSYSASQAGKLEVLLLDADQNKLSETSTSLLKNQEVAEEEFILAYSALTEGDGYLWSVLIKDALSNTILELNSPLSVTATSMRSLQAISSFHIYPNPANNNLIFHFPQGHPPGTMQVRNILGTIVKTIKIPASKNIDISDLLPGIYSITIPELPTESKLLFKR